MKQINVKKLREKLGLTRDELAWKLDVTPRAVRSWEEKARNPSGPARKLLEQLEAE